MKCLTLALWSAVQTLRHRLSGEEVARLAADGVDQWALAYNEEGKAFFLHRTGIAVWAKTTSSSEPCWRMEERSSSSNIAWERVLLPTVAQRYIVYLCLGKIHSGRQANIKVYVDGIFATGSAVIWMQMYCHERHCYRPCF